MWENVVSSQAQFSVSSMRMPSKGIYSLKKVIARKHAVKLTAFTGQILRYV